MKKHTLQEYVDFTGCYVVKDGDLVSFYHDKPRCVTTIHGKEWWSSTCYGDLSGALVADFDTHDWHILVEPHIRG